GLVDRLEREGLAKRVREGKDRRVVHVALTKKGATAHGRMRGQMRAKLHGFICMLDPAERKTLLRILEKVVERLGAPGDQEPVTKDSP
ncbi:MAG: MarR family winged helix-turn-helix transcriptional regulator, partial [Myxococcaceae bacterium]